MLNQEHPAAVRRRWRLLYCENLVKTVVLYTLLLVVITFASAYNPLGPLGKPHTPHTSIIIIATKFECGLNIKVHLG